MYPYSPQVIDSSIFYFNPYLCKNFCYFAKIVNSVKILIPLYPPSCRQLFYAVSYFTCLLNILVFSLSVFIFLDIHHSSLTLQFLVHSLFLQSMFVQIFSLIYIFSPFCRVLNICYSKFLNHWIRVIQAPGYSTNANNFFSDVSFWPTTPCKKHSYIFISFNSSTGLLSTTS